MTDYADLRKRVGTGAGANFLAALETNSTAGETFAAADVAAVIRAVAADPAKVSVFHERSVRVGGPLDLKNLVSPVLDLQFQDWTFDGDVDLGGAFIRFLDFRRCTMKRLVLTSATVDQVRISLSGSALTFQLDAADLQLQGSLYFVHGSDRWMSASFNLLNAWIAGGLSLRFPQTSSSSAVIDLNAENCRVQRQVEIGRQSKPDPAGTLPKLNLQLRDMRISDWFQIEGVRYGKVTLDNLTCEAMDVEHVAGVTWISRDGTSTASGFRPEALRARNCIDPQKLKVFWTDLATLADRKANHPGTWRQMAEAILRGGDEAACDEMLILYREKLLVRDKARYGSKPWRAGIILLLGMIASIPLFQNVVGPFWEPARSATVPTLILVMVFFVLLTIPGPPKPSDSTALVVAGGSSVLRFLRERWNQVFLIGTVVLSGGLLWALTDQLPILGAVAFCMLAALAGWALVRNRDELIGRSSVAFRWLSYILVRDGVRPLTAVFWTIVCWLFGAALFAIAAETGRIAPEQADIYHHDLGIMQAETVGSLRRAADVQTGQMPSLIKAMLGQSSEDEVKQGQSMRGQSMEVQALLGKCHTSNKELDTAHYKDLLALRLLPLSSVLLSCRQNWVVPARIADEDWTEPMRSVFKGIRDQDWKMLASHTLEDSSISWSLPYGVPQSVPTKDRVEEAFLRLDRACVCEKFLPAEHSSFNPLIYSLDIVIPLLDLRQEREWTPRAAVPATGKADLLGVMIVLAETGLILVGWVLTLILASSLAGLSDPDRRPR